jgi:PRC-barrel domain
MTMQEGRSVATDETNTLISSDKVEGTSVYNRQGEKLGSIHTLMINKISGKVAYAVMSFGGFLGIGDRYHPLPWSVLTCEAATWSIWIGRCWKGRRRMAPAKRRTGATAPGGSRSTTTTVPVPIGSRWTRCS